MYSENGMQIKENNNVLMMYFDSQRNVMGDLYKNIANTMRYKERIILVFPSSYNTEEYSNDFLYKIKEDVSSEKNKIKRIYKLIVFIKRLKKIIKDCNIKKVYFQIDQLVYDYIFLLMNRNLKTIMWIHDISVHEGEGFIAELKKILAEYCLLPKIDNFFVSYNKAKNEFAEIYGIDYIKKTEVIYIPRLVELEFEDIKNAAHEIEYDFIFYGRIEKYKGLDLLIEAMNNPFLKNSKLLIIGRGREDRYIKNCICNTPNIQFINTYVSNRELANYITKSKFVILPYRNATGTQTIQLANYYGKMVLATRFGCFTEYIEDGVNGILIKECTSKAIAGAMYEALHNKEIEEKRIESRLSMFDLSTAVRKIENVLMN
ncbi:glycosyltransferase family 4 protein [Selenomonas ruminantium]|uniref:Glycosyltransferase involved in cell wall bisynthesis n=1 Tax=Selenomonas ruminantium TaxID=971 RepID=A0A1H0UFH0_SELRU|nr:glycosyltransferase family 4 protein [Selenomonas ruminantium]SDP64748.1 Glycosyltransferase involved in cell wall bisynthesis [Selenomonas ruminantium]